jgi:hypothetical protein
MKLGLRARLLVGATSTEIHDTGNMILAVEGVIGGLGGGGGLGTYSNV